AIKLFGQFAPGLFGCGHQVVQVAGRTTGRKYASGAEQVDELRELGLIVGQALGVEPFVRLLVRALVVKPCLTNVRDDDPVAGQVDRILVPLIDGGHPSARIRSLKRVARPFALDDDDERPDPASTESSDGGVGELTVDLDVLLTGERIVAAPARRAFVPE